MSRSHEPPKGFSHSSSASRSTPASESESRPASAVRRVVVLGTGTGIGKTWLSTALVETWGRQIGPAWGLKPIESGVESSAAPSDARELALVSTPGWAPNELTDHLHRYALPEPVSPHLAARREGMIIDVRDVSAWVSERERTRMVALRDMASGVTSRDGTWLPLSVVETAGAVFSPLSAEASNFDLATRLVESASSDVGPSISPRVVLVAPDRLGVLSDVTAYLQAMARSRLRVDLVVLSAPPELDASTGRNGAELERVVFPALGPAAPRVAVVPLVARGQRDVAEVVDLLSV